VLQMIEDPPVEGLAHAQAPASDDPWHLSKSGASVMEKKRDAAEAYDAATIHERITAEREADDALHSVAAGQDTESKVKAELAPAIAAQLYRPAALQVNVWEHSGSEDPKMPKPERESAKFGQQLAAMTNVKTNAVDVRENEADTGSPVTTTSYMRSYDHTMREIKFKSLKEKSLQQSMNRAVTLKAEAVSEEKKSATQAQEDKLEYLQARVSQARKSLEAAKASSAQGLDPATAGELVAEEQHNLNKVLKKLNLEHVRLRRVREVAGRHHTEAGTEAEIRQQEHTSAMAKAAYEKDLAMRFVEQESEKRVKHKKSTQLKTAERQRKSFRKDELEAKQSAAKESQGKSLENRNKGAEQARLMEGGAACTLSPWSKYSACSKPCGGGMRSSVRRVLTGMHGKSNPNGCPATAKGKPCNQHSCEVKGTAAPKDMSMSTCEPSVSNCAKFTAQLDLCNKSPTPDNSAQPSETQMIMATEFSSPEPSYKAQDPEQPQPSTEDTIANLPSSDSESGDTVREMGEDWQARNEADEIRLAIGHMNGHLAGARSLLGVHDCKQAQEDKGRHCQLAQACKNQPTDNVGHLTALPDMGESMNVKKVPTWARSEATIGTEASDSFPQDEDFDQELTKLDADIPH